MMGKSLPLPPCPMLLLLLSIVLQSATSSSSHSFENSPHSPPSFQLLVELASSPHPLPALLHRTVPHSSPFDRFPSCSCLPSCQHCFLCRSTPRHPRLLPKHQTQFSSTYPRPWPNGPLSRRAYLSTKRCAASLKSSKELSVLLHLPRPSPGPFIAAPPCDLNLSAARCVHAAPSISRPSHFPALQLRLLEPFVEEDNTSMCVPLHPSIVFCTD
jgi:hypothetical protein